VGAGTIVATASTAEKLELAAKNGATHGINYSKEDWVARVKEITNGEGVIAVFDGVGAATFEGDLEVLARKGTLASFGNASGPVPPFSISRLAAKNIKVLRPTLFNYLATKEEFATYTQELLDLIKTKKVDVRIHKVYSLADAAQAHKVRISPAGISGRMHADNFRTSRDESRLENCCSSCRLLLAQCRMK
jgi:NADPH2:quinone reductase